ncbi:MAG: hypothetical protein KF744_16570 [Taibaiella sp.]|nr:hypothetical protein [Taibaiella sp.]
MKKVFLTALLGVGVLSALAQKSIFMEILENKKICNKEDQLTYFLQSNSFERGVDNRYYHRYVVNGKFYTTTVINEMECYAIYQTNYAKDYNDIKAAITSSCAKELAADKSEYYVCNKGRAQDVEITLEGYLEDEKVYEIKVYQNPDGHELPYNQADRVVPVTNKPAAKPVTKKKRKALPKVQAAETAATVVPSKTATPASPHVVPTSKTTGPVTKNAAPPVMGGAPPVHVSKPKEATVKSVTPTPGKK